MQKTTLLERKLYAFQRPFSSQEEFRSLRSSQLGLNLLSTSPKERRIQLKQKYFPAQFLTLAAYFIACPKREINRSHLFSRGKKKCNDLPKDGNADKKDIPRTPQKQGELVQIFYLRFLLRLSARREALITTAGTFMIM